jgi:hypothetical protein
MLVSEGLAALQDNTLTLTKRRILLAMIDDRPGALHEFLLTLATHNFNSVEDCYGFAIEEEEKAAIVFEVEKLPEASKALEGTTVPLVTCKL